MEIKRLLVAAMLMMTLASVAMAENRCGKFGAGKLTNDTNYSILVKGDTRSSTGVERWIPPGGTAAQSGICDADHFSTQVDFRREPSGAWYSAGGPYKISTAHVRCEMAPDYYEQPTRCWW